MNRVTIRTKKKSKGTMLSVFLEYNPAFVNPKGEEVRYEFLNLEKYVNPISDIEKRHNEMIGEIAEAIRCDRYMRNTMVSNTSVVTNTSKDSVTTNALSRICP